MSHDIEIVTPRSSPAYRYPLHAEKPGTDSRLPDPIVKVPQGGEDCVVSSYPGAGTIADPFVVDWDLADPENPRNWKSLRKWSITCQLGLATWTVSFSSSSYSGGLVYIMRDLHVSEELAVLGISLYVLGFGVGPLVFAPMGEMFGRRIVFIITFTTYTLLHLGGALGRNITTLLICRFLSGILGSSPLTNAGGTISDVFNDRDRGVATAIYATAPFLGPIVGPVVGGFVAQNPGLGWRFNFWLMMIFSAGSLVFGFLVTPETYAPVLLRRRAASLTKASHGTAYYVSIHDIVHSKSFSAFMRINMSRPFRFIVTEPIVTLLAIYVSSVYGTLYALFSAFPIVFQQHRDFTPGQGGLAFMGVGLGVVSGTAMAPLQNIIYWRAMDRSATGKAPPEARLHMSMVGGVVVPIGLFWFAWTTETSVPWIIPILAGIPFGVGVAAIMQGGTAYLMDAYGIYFASAIAATVVLRSILGAVFPLIIPSLFDRVGEQWGMSLFAFIALACMPIPMLFWRYGRWIRSQSKFAYKEAASELEPSGLSSQRDTLISSSAADGDLEKLS